MCGIAGFIDTKIPNNERDELLEGMLDSIAHRGPDYRGKWIQNEVALGHNRLSIIDLSDEGNQPMHYDSVSIVFNGEIYNYLEIKSDLEKKGIRFHSHSDTEVILASYKEWGSACVQKFVGMWAFAIWDETKKELFCSRDRFGIKPFYYIYNSDRFYFGSEYKALKKSPIYKNDLNLNQVARGLQLGWNCYHDETYFECITSLPAAHNLIYKEGKISIERYWDIATEQTSKISSAEAAFQFRNLFLDSMKLHMRSDVEVGGCLSGGLDSSAIAGSIGTIYPTSKFKTFTVYYEGKNEVDERPWVDEVLKMYPHFDPYYFTPTNDDLVQSFDRAIYHADVPIAGSSPISQYFVMQLAASKGIKVLLDGQGSDEMLGGYMHSFYRLIGDSVSKLNFGKAYHELNAQRLRQEFSGGKTIDLFLKSALTATKKEQQLYEMEYLRYFPFLQKDKHIPFELKQKSGSRLNQFLYQLMTTTSLPSLLQFEDRNSMAYSIESRVPFLDHRLVEFIFSLSDEEKIKNAVTKRVLRDGMNGILPDAIKDRKDKKGFVTPGEVKWLRGPLAYLLEQNFSSLDFLQTDRVKTVIDDFKKGDNKNANLVWRIAVLKYWMERNGN